MSTYKRIDGDYSITTINSTDNVFITTHTVKIDGNLDVMGNLTYIDTTELEITDPFITLAANNASIYSNIGILAQKTISPNSYAALRFNVTSNVWQVSTDNVNFSDIALGNTIPMAGGSNTQIQFNDEGNLNGSPSLTIDKNTSTLTLAGVQNFELLGYTPGVTANTVSLYHQATGEGGTGLYVKSASVDNELVSKSKAIIFSLIF